jgi:hypothetical protein
MLSDLTLSLTTLFLPLQTLHPIQLAVTLLAVVVVTLLAEAQLAVLHPIATPMLPTVEAQLAVLLPTTTPMSLTAVLVVPVA